MDKTNINKVVALLAASDFDANIPTVIVVVGPTAVGKTAFAIALAQHFNTQIISADSRQCYNELNIGVAKPTAAELAAVKHHFISSHSINQEVNAGVFEKYALDAAAQIFKNAPVKVENFTRIARQPGFKPVALVSTFKAFKGNRFNFNTLLKSPYTEGFNSMRKNSRLRFFNSNVGCNSIP